MADNNLDIYLRIITQQTGEKPEAVLAKIKDQVKETGKEAVKQEENVKQATEKTIKAKDQLKAGIKGLGAEFPILGRLANLALNPITASVLMVVGAFKLWNERVEQLTRSLGGVAMPDVTESQVERINRMNAALERQTSAVKALGDAVSTIKSDISEDAAIWRALGFDLGTTPEQMKAEADMAAAQEAAVSGADKRARGAKIDPGELKRLESLATTAGTDKTAAQGRLMEIAEMEGMAPWDLRRIYFDNKFRMRYGGSLREGGTPTYAEARRMEEATIGQSDAIIGRYSTAVTRDRLYREGGAEIGAAAGMAQSGKSGFAGVAATEAGQLREAAQQFEKASLAELVPAILNVAKQFSETSAAIQRDLEAMKVRDAINRQRP